MPNDLPVRNPNTRLRRKTRTISAEFTVTDDIVRSYPDHDGKGNFRPWTVSVTVDLDTGAFSVRLSGQLHTTDGSVGADAFAVFGGDGWTHHYLDVDHEFPGLVCDAVVECLTEHADRVSGRWVNR